MDANLVQSYLRMLTSFISEPHQLVPATEGKPLKNAEDEEKLIRIYCAQCAVWSLGANLHENSRKKFIGFLRPRLQRFCPDVPADGDLYTYSVSDDDNQFIELATLVPDFKFDLAQPFFNILVPTTETVGQKILTENLMAAGFHVLFSAKPA